ncbi:P-loop containing nucleoside triphosphate hydrolase protein [Diplogelasinospora grovesii]|uniref:P-loop containing nucleoside triphosphate hydrolase protein n=1 Tax=Diplogelasinospora grovesii TaxID=303347 RepID=A0AAN6N4K5_9PEZI|nr:P-loop containing nucleoside triphosphate hydrolase protein [Diplogelasinospora grovesii]
MSSNAIATGRPGRVFHARLPCHFPTPDPSPTFVGRDDILSTLDDELLPRAGNERARGPQTFALCGIGGIGKSEIALQFMRRRRGSFDATFFISAENPDTFDKAFSDMALKLELLTRKKAQDRQASIRTTVREWLSKPCRKSADTTAGYAKWLLVLDNVGSGSLRVLRECIPLGGPGSILLTSRDPGAKHYLFPDAPRGLDLGPLAEEAAAGLLQRRSTGQTGNPDAALPLVRRLDCLPAAIVHAADFIKAKGGTSEKYLKRYEIEISLPWSEAEGVCARTLGRRWKLESLPGLLSVLALLDCDIRESLLRLNNTSGQPVIADPESACNNLAGQSLIRRSGDGEKKTLSIHQVVQDAARQMMGPSEFRRAFETSLALLDAGAADVAAPHVVSLFRHFPTLEKKQTELQPLSLKTFMKLVVRAAMYEPQHPFSCVLSTNPFRMGEQYADILMSLSSAYHCIGNGFKGMFYAKLHFDQRKSDSDVLSLEMAYAEFLLALLLNGEFGKAEQMASDARKILMATEEFKKGEFWPQWVDFHLSWAAIGEGRAKEARRLMEGLLKWRQEKYGEKDVKSVKSMKTAYAYQILGVVEEKADMIDKAIKNWEISLNIYKRTEGEHSFRTNQVRVKLGEYYGQRGRHGEAVKLFETALEYFGKGGYYKAERARTLFKKSQFLERDMEDKTGAKKARREAEEVWYAARIEYCYNGAQFLDKMGNKVAAEKFWTEAKELEDTFRQRGARKKVDNLKLRDFDNIVMIMSR